jgi:hypothetical protein
MLNLTCTFCRAPINLNDGDLALIMAEVGDQRPKSYPVPCPSCRRTNKVPMKRIQQAYRLAGSPPLPEIPAPQEDETSQQATG